MIAFGAALVSVGRRRAGHAVDAVGAGIAARNVRLTPLAGPDTWCRKPTKINVPAACPYEGHTSGFRRTTTNSERASDLRLCTLADHGERRPNRFLNRVPQVRILPRAPLSSRKTSETSEPADGPAGSGVFGVLGLVVDGRVGRNYFFIVCWNGSTLPRVVGWLGREFFCPCAPPCCPAKSHSRSGCGADRRSRSAAGTESARGRSRSTRSSYCRSSSTRSTRPNGGTVRKVLRQPESSSV